MLHLYVFFYAAPGRAASVYVYLQDPMLHLDCFGCLNTALKHRKNWKFFLFHETNRKTTKTDWVSVQT
jgi:hypothetical protein